MLNSGKRRASVARALYAALLLVACGDSSSTGVTTPPKEPEAPKPPAAPVTPAISVPQRIRAGTIATASIAAQTGATYTWTITGGEVISGAGTTEITFRRSLPGAITLRVTATNSAGVMSSPGEASVSAYTVLTTVMNGDVSGSPVTGTREFDTAIATPYSYAPAAGAATAFVEIDNMIGSSSGQLTMDKDRVLWAYGQPATGIQFSNMIVVPNDPTIIPSMSFYASRPAVDVRVADPYCGVTQPSSTYPRSYLGAFPMPTATGAPLAGSTQRGVTVKDYWAFITNNPTTNEGCRSDWHAAVEETMRRVKRLGADYIAIYQNAYLEDVNANTLKFDCTTNQTCPSWAQIPDAEILWAAERARSYGLNLYLYLQVDVHDIQRKPLPSAPTAEFLNRFYDAWRQYLLHMGRLAEQARIPVMQVDWGVWWFDMQKPEYRTAYLNRMPQIAADVKAVYSGQRALGVLAPWQSNDDALMAQTDLLILELWQTRFLITAADNANLTPAIVRDRTAQYIKNIGGVLGKYNKPAIFNVMNQSHRDYFSKGWIEDGFCVDACSQNNVTIDFSVQAIAYQGQFEAINTQTTFPVRGVNAVGYWFADVLLPNTSFPNLSQSIRGKPAEAIVYRWFRR